MSASARFQSLTAGERVANGGVRPPTLRLLAISITDTCNQNCGFCSRRASVRKQTHLSPALHAEIIADARQMGELETLVLTGGEPFLHPRFEDILDLSTPGPWALKLNTNGTILSGYLLDLLHRHHVTGVTVSLDGDTADLHDRVRKMPGSFAVTIRNMRRLVSAGFQIYVNTNVLPINVERVERVVPLVHDLGAVGMNISRIYPIGRARANIRTYFLSHDVFRAVIGRCLAQKPFGFDLRFEDQALRHLLDPRFTALKGMLGCLAGPNICVGCFAGKSMLHVEPNGDVLACGMLERPVGNIRFSRLGDIWAGAPILSRLRHRDLLKGSCGGCFHREICGGCRGRAYGLFDDEQEEDPYCPMSTKTAEAWVV